MPTYRHPLSVWITLVVLGTLLFASGCSTSGNRMVESAPNYQPPPVAPQIKIPDVTPARPVEVQEAVRRVFKQSVVIDSSTNPNFFTGDFNGDLSQDLAVIIRPLPDKLAEMNEEYPPWLLRDPTTSDEDRKIKLSVEENDVLLAIIHGYGDNDWRDSQATQTFVLKNVVGSNPSVRTAKDFLSANSGRKLPRPQGDLIEQTVHGTNGYLYYASTNYSWYDPKTFKTKPRVAMVHGTR